jgi:hypothetical protein
MGRPCTSARAILSKYHQSCVAGHQQGRDIAYGKRADGKPITAIIAGSFYLHDEPYLNPITNSVWRGIYMLHEVNQGSFDEMAVSIGYLERKYRVGTSRSIPVIRKNGKGARSVGQAKRTSRKTLARTSTKRKVSARRVRMRKGIHK